MSPVFIKQFNKISAMEINTLDKEVKRYTLSIISVYNHYPLYCHSATSISGLMPSNSVLRKPLICTTVTVE